MTTRSEDELLLHAYVDGELDAAAALDFERRLAENADLASRHTRLLALRQALRDKLPRHPAPARLRSDILDRLAIASPPHEIPVRRPVAFARRDWMAMAATLLVGLGLGGTATYVALGDGARDSVAAQALDAAVDFHVRALAAGTPFDIASSDHHTVKPWFAGKLTFAPQVLDLADQGFPLAGGRVDVIAGRTAATLVFRRDKHLISLTEAFDPDGKFKGAGATSREGFSVRHWWEGGLAYWAVSDAAPDEVEAFAAAFRARATATKGA